MNPPNQPAEFPYAAELLTTKTPFRVYLANVLATVGLLIAAAAQADWGPILAFLPDESRATLTGWGLAIVAAKPILNTIFDVLDDGLLNGSRKLLPIFILGMIVVLSSCGLSVSPDGCATFSYMKDGQEYRTGPCFGEDGKVSRWRASWYNKDGVKIRSTYTLITKRLVIEYWADGGWLGWDSKSGLVLDGNPLVAQIVAEQKSSANVNEVRPENLPSASRPEIPGVPAGGL